MTNLRSLLERAKPYIVDSVYEWQERPDHEVHRLLHDIEIALQAEPPAPQADEKGRPMTYWGGKASEPRAVHPRVFRGNGPVCLGCGKTIREHLTNYNFCPGLPENDIEHQSIGRAQNWPADPTPPHLLKQGYRSGHVFSTHWSKDPLVPYQGCDCSSCAEVRDRGMVEAK